MEKTTLYQIVSSHREPNGDYTIVAKLSNTIGKVFKISATELVNRRREVLKGFSMDDIISIIGIASNQQDSVLIHKKKIYFRYFVLFAMLFNSLFILADVASVKLVDIAGYPLPAGTIAFAGMYSIGNFITEVYGFKRMRFITWIAVLCHIICVLYINFTVMLPPASAWLQQEYYGLLADSITNKIIISSTISYVIGEFANSYIISKTKLIYQGRYLLPRILLSSVVGITVNTFIFIFLAYRDSLALPALLQLIIHLNVAKLIFEIMSFPATLLLINFIKRKEQTDIYDHNTSFNPFSFDIEYTEENNFWAK